MDFTLLMAFVAGVACLLGLILWLRVNAFVALLVASIVVGVASGMEAELIF